MVDKKRAKVNEAIQILTTNGSFEEGQQYLVKEVLNNGYTTYIFTGVILFKDAVHVAGYEISDKYTTKSFNNIHYSVEESINRRRGTWAKTLRPGDFLEVRVPYYPWVIGEIIKVAKGYVPGEYDIKIENDTTAPSFFINPFSCELYARMDDEKEEEDDTFKNEEKIDYLYKLGPIDFKGYSTYCPSFEASTYPSTLGRIPKEYIIHGSTIIHEDRDIHIIRRKHGLYFIRFKTDTGYTTLGFLENRLQEAPYEVEYENTTGILDLSGGVAGDVLTSAGDLDKAIVAVANPCNGGILIRDNNDIGWNRADPDDYLFTNPTTKKEAFKKEEVDMDTLYVPRL